MGSISAAEDEAISTAYSAAWPVPKPDGEKHAQRRRPSSHQDSAGRATTQAPPETGITNGHMGADNEHHEPEADLGKEGERGLGGVEVAQPRPAQDDPHKQLTDDHRHVPGSRKCQEGADQTGQDDERQRGEVHEHLLSRTSPAVAVGTSHEHVAAAPIRPFSGDGTAVSPWAHAEGQDTDVPHGGAQPGGRSTGRGQR